MKRQTKSEIRNQKSETVLFAVTGMSPAVITETVWALAHEKPAVFPDRIIVVTTVAGRAAIQRELFDTSIWDKLRAALAPKIRVHPRSSVKPLRFGTTADDIRVFTRGDAHGHSVELEDIRTPADNEAAADFLLCQLRSFTENPDVSLICSIAGGRKTMGTLLYACLSLIGRETDRLTHVLVSEPYDDVRLRPRFYFPTQPAAKLLTPDGEKLPAIKARIDLADVPFVPLRNLFREELGRLPGGFLRLVDRCRRDVRRQLVESVRLLISRSQPLIEINGNPIDLTPMEQAAMLFLAKRATDGAPPFAKYLEALEPFRDFCHTLRRQCPANNFADWRGRLPLDSLNQAVAENDDVILRKIRDGIRSKLLKHGFGAAEADLFLPRKGRFGIDLSPARIRIQN